MSLIETLEWDSSFFGFPIGRVQGNVTAGEIDDAIREGDSRGLVCMYLLAPADDVELLDSAQRRGFLVRDMRVELERPVAGHIASMVGLRRARTDDARHLEQLVRTRFRATRFFSDYGFDRTRVEEMYVMWLRRGLRGDDGWVTLVSDDALGFVACELSGPSSEGLISLIAVAADADGRGLGSSLMAGAGSVFLEADMQTAKVITQGSNISAQRLYQAHGYRTGKVSLWLHRWTHRARTMDACAPDLRAEV